MSLFKRQTERESDLERRERLRLTESISAELRKQDSLKKSILDELGQSSRWSRLFRHPASLVVLTFAFTTGLGTWLSNRWQNAEQKRQETLQSQQRALEQKYQIANDAAKAIGEIHASTTAVFAAMQLDSDRERLKELKRIVPEWKKAKSDWLVNYSVLLGKITVNFSSLAGDPPHDARSDFEDIFNNYKQVSVELVNMIEKVVAKGGVRELGMEAKIQELLTRMNTEIKGRMTKHLLEHMAQEIRSP